MKKEQKTPQREIELGKKRLKELLYEVVTRKGLTHAQVATLAHTSRTRVTAMMNRNTHDISTDLMIRILGSLGYTAKISFAKAA